MKNPIANALFAALYIVGLVHLMQYIIGSVPEGSSEGILVPISMLALFVLSASVMGYLFIVGPVELYLAGQKAEGVRLFLATVAVFAVLTGLFLAAMFYDAVKREADAPLQDSIEESEKGVEAFGQEI